MIVGAWLGADVEWVTPAGRRFVQVGTERIEVESAEELLASLETEAAPEGAVLLNTSLAPGKPSTQLKPEERTT